MDLLKAYQEEVKSAERMIKVYQDALKDERAWRIRALKKIKELQSKNETRSRN